MSKKGFTLVELIAVLALLLIVSLLIVPNLFNMQDESKAKAYESKKEYVLSRAIVYGKDILDELTSESCLENAKNIITVGELINKGYLTGDSKDKKTMLDPRTKKDMNCLKICLNYPCKDGSCEITSKIIGEKLCD
ncbi:MAG: prepilin-type N-terminal cleavage/methylation domain-containing protein [Bacilli bacterium]